MRIFIVSISLMRIFIYGGRARVNDKRTNQIESSKKGKKREKRRNNKEKNEFFVVVVALVLCDIVKIIYFQMISIVFHVQTCPANDMMCRNRYWKNKTRNKIYNQQWIHDDTDKNHKRIRLPMSVSLKFVWVCVCVWG